MCTLPQPVAEPEAIPYPQDKPFPGTIRLEVDATDVERRIFRVRETIPVSQGGPMTLLFPKWLPGYHSPQAPIELFAGLVLRANGEDLPWRRHPVEIHAFQLEVPQDCSELVAEFQFLSPTDRAQGRVIYSHTLLALPWNAVLLYPGGYFSRGITVEASLSLPDGWHGACALTSNGTEAQTTRFEPASLDTLVDSPVFAGRHWRRIALDDQAQVHLNIVADAPELLPSDEAHIDAHRAVVAEADALFGARHFDRYEFLLALSDEIDSAGVEHHRSAEAATVPDYFANWDRNLSRRDTIPHEYIHSWNGKYRRGEDSWTPSFDRPIRNSLMWVYEGLTQYWDRVLCARSGLWNAEQSRDALALTAATHAVRAGSRWRPMSDTTRDPIIAARSPLPWPSWQRSEDYYSEGALVWLDVDTRLRELSGDTKSLDDFAQGFFGGNDGIWVTQTYAFDDVVAALDAIAPFDWGKFFASKLDGKQDGAPLEGLERGGYRLAYRSQPGDYWTSMEAVSGITNLSFSLGLTVSSAGRVEEVLWESPAFRAGLTAGCELVAVDSLSFSVDGLQDAVARAAEGPPLRLLTRHGKHHHNIEIECRTGNRYPYLERIADARGRLDEILAPRR
jgi:predicted metalloprotease with PDZ domain